MKFKTTCIITLLLITSIYCFAAPGDPAAGLTAATTQLRRFLAPLMYVIGAAVGLWGAIRVYNKWQGGDQDTQKALVQWLAAFIFLMVAATVITAFTGETI
jgi:hypothetical protein